MNNHAQTSMSENELKRYFELNILNLNPLEGIYFVKNSHNLFFKDEVNNYLRAFLFSKQKNSYEELYYDKDDGRYKYLQQIQYDSSTHIFRYISTNRQFLVTDPGHFSFNTNDGTTYDNQEYVRVYPTEEMYAEANWENKVQEASNHIQNGFFSSALDILDDVMKNHKGSREYYYRASAYYGLKKFYAAIQDCNYALSYNNSEQNNYMIYYLRGLCHFLTDDKESGIADMKKAGEDGAKFLEEEGYTKTSSGSHNAPNGYPKNPKAKNNKTPILKKTK
jgi:hypothetical protein